MALTKVQSEMAGAGQVLQVVQSSTTTLASNSTTTYADTGLSATITPKSATSKILVLFSQSCYKSSTNQNNAVNLKLFRNSTDLGRMVYVQGYTFTASEMYSNASQNYLDSPATTSAITYKTQFANQTASSVATVQADNIGLSTMTLMEIAA